MIPCETGRCATLAMPTSAGEPSADAAHPTAINNAPGRTEIRFCSLRCPTSVCFARPMLPLMAVPRFSVQH